MEGVDWRALHAETIVLGRGEWKPPRQEPQPGHLGYLVLEGIVLREVHVLEECSLELLGEGDLLKPWLEDAASFAASRWRVPERAKLAVLAPDVYRRLGTSPARIAAISDSAMLRSRALAVFAALTQFRRVEDRLEALFWYLAERWGKVVDDGAVAITLPLTHEDIARLVSARRPSVTTAFGQLAEAGTLVRTGPAWILRGSPPELAQPPTSPPKRQTLPSP